MLLATLLASAAACASPASVCAAPAGDGLSLIDHGTRPRIVVNLRADPAVAHAATALDGDLDRLAGAGAAKSSRLAIIVGVLGHDPTIDRLAAAHRIDVAPIRGRWEAYLQQVVDHPAPGIDRALVIAGADRRGTAFGAYDLSRRAGVSPWTWWADVPVTPVALLRVAPGARIDAPVVRYRGLFINDEDPALGGWSRATFGGVGTNHLFYQRFFDLVLRLKGNMIWPAMWGRSLWQDDPESAKVAQDMGVILGTSHHEPMLRANIEWKRANLGAWDYTINAATLQRFWREGLVRNAGRDALVTIGMRGDGDEPMTQGTAIPLLERIVADQRRIITDVTGKPADQTPQVWALYKEVQDYYDKGMRVPPDVTLLFSDDNWGNIRRLPPDGEHRPGGYGVYYHFDYVGDPRNYKWVNVTQIGRVWEQMSLAHARGANQLWIANVGDVKPMELPSSFFLDLAWNPAAYGPDSGRSYLQRWAAEQFGPAPAAQIADVLDRETRFVARRHPELTDADTWTLAEWDAIAAEDRALVADAQAIGRTLPAAMQDAYFELVLHPVLATTNLRALYHAVALNRDHARRHLPDTDALAVEAEQRFAEDRALATRYEACGGNKWPHMMDQTHIGYTTWQQPDRDVMPRVYRLADAPPPPAPTMPPPIRIDADAPATALAATARGQARWTPVAGLGLAGSAMTPMPQTAPAVAPGAGPSLHLDVSIASGGPRVVSVVAAPSIPVTRAARLRYALSVDGGAPVTVDLAADQSDAAWRRSVIANARVGATPVTLAPGRHRLRVWMIDPAVVIERVVVADRAVDPLRLVG